MVGDWKFGDVLALALAGHPPHRIMFIGRKTPLALNADGTLRHWPFEGIGLPSECDKSWRICGQDHGVGKMGGFGGHPSVSWGDTGWTLEEEL